jgi:hypothetical protein
MCVKVAVHIRGSRGGTYIRVALSLVRNKNFSCAVGGIISDGRAGHHLAPAQGCFSLFTTISVDIH